MRWQNDSAAVPRVASAKEVHLFGMGGEAMAQLWRQGEGCSKPALPMAVPGAVVAGWGDLVRLHPDQSGSKGESMVSGAVAFVVVRGVHSSGENEVSG